MYLRRSARHARRLSMIVTAFVAGTLLCNAAPHAAAGLRGEAFPTPFAKPRGRGLSSPLVNVYWGAANLVAGAALLCWTPVTPGFNAESLALVAGALAIGTFLAIHFGRVRAGSPGA